MLDRSHMPPGTTAITQHLMTLTMTRGMRRVFAELGVPAETLEMRFVHGHPYTRLRPLIGAGKPPTKLPPLPILKLVTRLHPAMRRRNATAARSMAAEPWLRVIDEWHKGGRADLVRRNLAIQDVDLRHLDEAALFEHVHRCLDHCTETIEHHFWLHGFDIGPIGQLLHAGRAWGVGSADLLPLLEGASPSTSAPSKLLTRIREAVEASGVVPESLDDVRRASPDAAELLDDYLRHHGALLFSRYDVDGLTLGERPDLVLASILHASVHDANRDTVARTARVRDRIPSEHRARFDQLLRNARGAMDLRDDNGPITAEWPMGLLRLALLELGERLALSGAADDREHVFELHVDEIEHRTLPGAGELAARAERRRAQKRLDPPRTIGPEEVAPPPSVLPGPLREMVEMVQVVMAEMGMDGAVHTSVASELDGSDADGLRGCGIGDGPVTGTARVAESPEAALDTMDPGDILVVTCTTPAYNVVLSLAGGVVTAEGGPMSHAAVLARELGIPAVVGAADALSRIPDGARVEVDPVAGRVRVL
jgi:phosphohistidine swiveling domain-containing protein